MSRTAILLLSLLLAACGGENRHDDAKRARSARPAGARGVATAGWQERDGWLAGVAASLDEKLGGCALGDVLPAIPGDEIVVCGESGRVWLLAAGQGGWQTQELGRATGETIQVAVGELDPRSPGPEIVAVGMAEGTEESGGEGAVSLLRAGPAGWRLDEIHRSPALVHAVTIADLDGDEYGNVIVVAGFARQVVRLVPDGDGWQATVLATLDGSAKSMVAHGGGVVVACADGALVQLQPQGDGSYRPQVLDQAIAGLARVGSDGERLLVARDDGVLQLVTDQGVSEVHRESGKLRGAVLANVDPVAPALELATAGYGRRVTVLTLGEQGWSPQVVWEDDDRLHHLAAGRLPAVGPFVSLVACGYSGRVVVVARAPAEGR